MVLHRLQDEIKEVLGETTYVTNEQLEELKYTEQVNKYHVTSMYINLIKL